MAQHQSGAGSHGHDDSHGSVKSYVIGFILSIVLTIIPLGVVMNHMLSRTSTMVVILAAAVLQFLVQLFFFMHIRESNGPRWNVMTLILGVVILLTVVGGSVWIMEYNMVAH
ncbi:MULTISPECIES: cytochrome o ubiquinol oxidase subunit IV [Paenibacillus]|uniref:Cytochrome o ubiquinol oxidase subunit IV n=2 Tax=Paenibacillus TaxID=44249 RepID=A0A7H0Y6X0_9BACL|nr:MULTISPECIES: cytochrome o ubiquinol oxidase subunit IV [Paenibacillus]KOS03968.1 heme transporter CcmD [Paenibacillus polymyxa]PNQ80923.1 cytochrome o ubiquinol oxidase subunit IV [Paenibacillus sp. F4]QNR66828.1 cytochrome o ubiquinol oxidase subunit IV [Paenibacillus peoriae]